MIAAEGKETRLGRGLSALFGEEGAAESQSVPGSASELPIHFLKPGKFQPRRHFDEISHATLVTSVKEKGVLEPILVRAKEGVQEEFEIIAGERRWRAAQAAGLHLVPVVVKEMDDREALEVALVENLHRSDLSPLEEAEAYSRLMKEFGHTQEGLAKSIGKSRSHVANMLRLLSLPSSVQEMVLEGKLSAGHARTLITASNPESLAAKIIAEGLSVREAERLAKRPIEKPTSKRGGEAVDRGAGKDPNTLELERSLSDRLGLKVVIDTKGESGSLSVYFQDLEQLDDLLQILSRT
ncbi:MAG TPA: chromosome partitioning protein ParB [Rhodospirillaceae bacterium]|nr:chromosome partitioning protein ParB [Rhodospirillaceae bacterium]HAA92264.1 chromosome partitioning protein ParB [Rhodospirillaceae bacterium]HAT36746.1 chromosome partitioning protein ParB [Rhodospirillaceae bacterium]|tara:strand:+ start:467 stop:1354 length:888 start_codon:yes stop_codon:yes gene_type:complete